MQNGEIPPVYSEYPTELPESFPIGTHKIQPLVNVTELQAHLRLLGAINKLKTSVEAQEDGLAATDGALAWVVFVNRAVHRFYIWASSAWSQISPGLNEMVMPPLDIMMVWHTYLLNPRAYYEDSQRMHTNYCTNLQAIQTMPLTLISSLIGPQTLEPVPPSTERQEFFERTTSLPFAIPLVTDRSDVVSLDCPFCLQKNHLVKWVASDEKGFAQPKFEYACESCQRPFNKSNIGVRRFAEEVTRRRTGQRVYLSETLLDPRTGLVDTKEADAFTNRVFKSLDTLFKVNTPIKPEQVPEQAWFLANGLSFDYNKLSIYLHTSIRPMYASTPKAKPLPRIQRISVAYSHAGLASLDLVGAILRQGSFVEKMVELGWTQPGRFDHVADSAPLVRSVARYHAFLDLMFSNPTSFFVPTLDIDLAWHSHQLKGEQYRGDTLRYLHRTPNHDDSVDASSLGIAYDITAKAWKERFGVPYSVCGCVPDPDSESRMSRFASKFGSIGSSKKEKEKENVVLRPVNSRPDLVSIEDDEADSSHPSEHNLQFGDPNDPMTKLKKDLREKRTMKCVASAKKGANRDPWRALQAERNEKRRAADHREAFTNPYYGYGYYYPYWGVSMAIPFGFYGGYAYGGAYGGCGTGCGAAGCGGAAGGCGGAAGGCGGGGGGCGGGGCGGGS